MHHIKRTAKFEAWKDKNNPFSRYRGPSRTNTLGDVEKGQNEKLTKIKTDDIGNQSSSVQARREEMAGVSLRAHAETLPDVHTSPTIDTGIEREKFPRSASPVQEDAEGKDTGTEEAPPKEPKPEETGKDGTDHSHSSFLEKTGLFKRKSDSKSSDTDGAQEAEDEKDDGKEKPAKIHYTWQSQIRATILNSWINILLIASPVGIAIYYAHVDPVAVFVINFIAIIPLAGMLSYATEEIALRVGETLGGLLNATFGNAVELIVSIIALAQRQTLIVQTSLIGSMLSNLLLVMGMCFFFGGFNRMEQAFNMTVAQTASSLLFLAVSALIIPTAFDQWAQTGPKATKTRVRELSRGTAVLLLIVYACYLFFQLKSHSKWYNEPSEKNPKRDLSKHTNRLKIKVRRNKNQQIDVPESRPDTPPEDENDGPEVPQLSVTVAVLTLAACTVLVALNAEYLVDSINKVTCSGGVNKNFVGLILLPIVGNAAEHATAVTVAVKDKMDLAIGVAVGSSMQIALLVLPFIVVLGWIMDRPGMTLEFDGFQIAVLFVAVLLVNYLIQDGKSHWLEGVLLQILYIIIAVAAWFYPADAGLNDCPSS